MSFICHECGAVLKSAATKHTLLGPGGCLDHLKAELDEATARIERMKCCLNCKDTHTSGSEEPCVRCNGKSRWTERET